MKKNDMNASADKETNRLFPKPVTDEEYNNLK
jgi:hypothetical protein